MNETRATIAITLAAVLCAWGAVEAWHWENVYQAQNRDPFQLRAQEVRLEPIAAAVPENAVIGYVSDLDAGSNADSAAFDSAEYVLAPRLLKRDAKESWVLGIIAKPEHVDTLAAANGLSIALPLSNGAVLYQQGSAR